jgi:hypothetical protein
LPKPLFLFLPIPRLTWALAGDFLGVTIRSLQSGAL